MIFHKDKSEILANRSLPPGLTVELAALPPSATLRGDPTLWKLIATKLIDHGLSHTDAPAVVRLTVSEGALELVQPDMTLSEEELEGLRTRLPQRASRRFFNPHLGLGAYLVFRLAENHAFHIDTQVRNGSLCLRVSQSKNL